jgi:hypothetical protein
MKAAFTPEEMLYNQIYQDRVMWVDIDGVDEQKIIDYLKLVPNSPIIQVHFHDGDVMEMSKYKSYNFDVTNKLQFKKATKEQIKQAKL